MKLSYLIMFLKKIFLVNKSIYLVSTLLTTFLGLFFENVISYSHTTVGFRNMMGLISFSTLALLVITVDWFLGVVASKKEGILINSKKGGNTIGKLTGLFLYLAIVLNIMGIVPKDMHSLFLIVPLYLPIVLIILNEYVSIGENFERINGKKPYIFTLFDKIITSMEKRLFKTIEDGKL